MIMRYGLQANLTNRLTAAATRELAALSLLLQDFQLTDAPDERFLTHGKGYSSRQAYQLLLQEDIEDDHAALIWRSRAPHKLKIFAWLLFRGRLNTKCNLFHKTIVPDASCPRCGGPSEDTAHLFLLCPHAARIWERLGLSPSSRFQDLWLLPVPANLNGRVWPEVLLMILSKIWDSRNAAAFRNESHSAILTVRNICNDLEICNNRFRDPVDKAVANSWLLFLTSRLAVTL
ncbi:hypothetical protein VPH35_046381 [Triticum aestivum]